MKWPTLCSRHDCYNVYLTSADVREDLKYLMINYSLWKPISIMKSLFYI